MPPAEGFLEHAGSGFTRSCTSSSSTSNRYENVHLSEESSAVIGNVVHQHFYPYRRSPTIAGEGGQDQAIELRNGFSQRQLDAISDYDHRYAHWLRAQQRIVGTCEWIVKLPEFMDWMMGKSFPILLCVGSVGCGKSTIASAVKDWLDEARVAPEPPILSFYVDAARPQPATTSEILRALVRQITIHYNETSIPMPADLYSEIESVVAALTSMPITILKLTTVVQHFLQLHPSCFLVVDGIDALPESEILVFANLLRQLWSTRPEIASGGRLILFCRETLGRRVRLDGIPASLTLRITLDHLRSDIHLYIDTQVDVKQKECCVTSDDALICEIKAALKMNSKKMFLWVHLQILSLWDPGITTCDDDIRDQLKRLPEGLDEIYLRCLRRIDSTNNGRTREIAPRMFRWLASAQTTLTPLQAREAVSMTPENLPLQTSQILSSPVTDYCANLVVFDDLTGMTKFVHPSVKDFLLDADKIPPELRHLSLLNEEDKVWCGRICLAHAKLHNARNRVVTFRSQEIEPRIASPIIRNVFANVLPFKMKARQLSSQKIPFRMPITAVPTHLASSVADLKLHNYIRQHWLLHNAYIRSDHPHYADFENLCLTHDPDLQPWSTTSVTNIEHYRRMVMHAVMTNHGPLLRIARASVEAKGSDYHDEIFQRFAPGTDSTYLHCAAVLGHVDVASILLDIPRYHCRLADTSWTSAAAAAMQAQQLEVFRLLLSRTEDQVFIPSWPLTCLALERPARTEKHHLSLTEEIMERLLDVCVMSGSLQAVQIVLSRAFKERLGFTGCTSTIMTRNASDDVSDLASAIFLACRHGHQKIGELLARYGADLQDFYWSDKETPFMNLPLLYKKRSALWLTLEFRDLAMLRTLLSVGRAAGIRINAPSLIEVLDFFNGRRQDWDPFITLLLEFSLNIIRRPSRHGHLWWLEELLTYRCLTTRDMGYLVRLILQCFYADWRDVTVRQARYCLPGMTKWQYWEAWMADATDDILIRLVNLDFIDAPFLTSSNFLRAAFARHSTRLLEAVLRFASRYEEYDNTLQHTGPSDIEHNVVMAVKSLVHTMLWKRFQDKHSIYPRFEIRGDQRQFMEVLLCSSFEQDGTWHRRRYMSEPIDHQIFDALEAYREDLKYPRYPCLLWIRCYSRLNGDVAATRVLCHELTNLGASGNFALNFPAGYSPCKSSTGRNPSWQISQKIWLALHSWNFRLNRARGRPHSESDMWYMAKILKQVAGRTIRQKAARDYDGIVVPPT